MSEWTRYQEVFLTDEENEYVDNYGLTGQLERNGREIGLLAQDDEKCTWGILHARGELLAIGAGYCYQSSAKTDFYDDLEALLENSDADEIGDCYVNSIVIDMPAWWSAKERRSFVRKVEYLTKKAIEAYRS